MKTLILLLALVLVGCGGSAFEENLFTANGGDGNGGESATGGSSSGTGGEGNHETGGASVGGSSNGGAPVEIDGGSSGGVDAGGTTTTGGTYGTGGAPSSTGGATGGAPVTGGSTGCTLVTHDNGLGQTWQDCVPLGTYDSTQATKACKASGAIICLESTRCGTAVYEVQGWNADSSQLIGEWGYGNFVTGYVSPNYNLCGTTNDPAVRRWN